ncbi:MAG: hypothetical protein CMK59_01085 [Proteobacteria bacterium]|nr:hypothetical protein [Pseudomonadota bacterium]
MILLILACSDQNSSESKPKETAPAVQKSTQRFPQHTAKGPLQKPSGRPLGRPPQHGNNQHHPPSGGHVSKSIKLEPNFSWSSDDLVSEQQRSIVLISLDTVRADYLSVYGGSAQVPLVEGVAQRGVRFSQAISHFPETALSHWSMMSGMLPQVHGNVPANGGSVYKGPTLAELAKEQGYATSAVIGGVTMTDQSSGFSRGFDSYDDQFSFSMEDMSRNGLEVSQKAANWISKHQRSQEGTKNPQPYFLFAHYFDAHFPYTPSSKYEQQYATGYSGTLDGSDAKLRPYRDGEKEPSAEEVKHIVGLYKAEIAELDAKLKPLLDVIDSETIVVITSDHGESFEHGYYFNHRAGLWDGVVHVPLIISAPHLPQNIEISQQVGLMDLLPTVLDLAGLKKDDRFMGKSLLSLIQGESEQGTDQVFSITDPWMPDPQFAVRTNLWKWISQEKGELVYDLKSDPLELSSLSNPPKDLSDSKTIYAQLIASTEKDRQKTEKRIISEEECARLEALGYTTCQH